MLHLQRVLEDPWRGPSAEPSAKPAPEAWSSGAAPPSPTAPEGDVRYLLIRDSYRNWGFPKGHLEVGEPPADAARREVAEETGLGDLVLHGPIKVIDWYFRFRGKTIHKYCHFFLFESREGEPVPQVEEGITACVWHPMAQALETVSYDNARGVLRRAGEMVRALSQPAQTGGTGGGP